MQHTSFSRLGLLATLLAFQGPGLAHLAVEPVPRGEDWWQQCHWSINQRVAEVGERVQVISIGDSISPGWKMTGMVTTTMDGSETTAKWSARRK